MSTSADTAGWEFWIDRGGTFTDVIGVGPEGELVVRKVPSFTRGEQSDPGLTAALSILRDAGIPADAIRALKVGTTVVTNALLERRGSRVLWVTTRGFADALVIGNQSRPDIFDCNIRRADPLHAEVLELDERVTATGEVLQAPDAALTKASLGAALERGCDAVAIVFMHGWCHTANEQKVAAWARELGFASVVASHELLPLPRFVTRGESTVFDAYLDRRLREYVEALANQLAAYASSAELQFMQSSGGLTDRLGFRALGSVLSGPAGGLIGLAQVGRRAGRDRLIGFDMGGTSTDVSVFDAGFARRFEHIVQGHRIATPMLDVHTIAAGGGSILRREFDRDRVGPESAGADPGPACYGRGGPATLTDVQAILGRLSPDSMPRVFGPARDAPIDVEAARAALQAIDPSAPIERLAAGFLEVAVQSMANAIRHVSVRQGIDPAGFTLVAFGGAAGQHACRVAAAAGLDAVLIHPLASVLSAYGIGVADKQAVRRRGLDRPLDEASWTEAQVRFDELVSEACAALGAAPGRIQKIFEIRDGHAETALDAQGDTLDALRCSFRDAHRKRYGYAPDDGGLQLAALRVEAVCDGAHRNHSVRFATPPPASVSARVWFDGWQDVPVIPAAALERRRQGPLLLVEPNSTFVLEPGWEIEPLATGALLAKRSLATREGPRRDVNDPAQVEIFDGLFMHIATQMGEVLRRTAQSVNIKERLDFSCAIFDAHGGLVANAPHMPVHLGSMGATVEALLAEHGNDIRQGDAWLVNSPRHGGTHLPDMTVVSPVYLGQGKAVSFFVASRAHHADIGGITPGSMPPFSRQLAEEGAIFDGLLILRDGVFLEADIRAAFSRGRWPARNPAQNLADLRAALAANATGIAELARAAERESPARLGAAMRAVQDNAAIAVEAAIAALGDLDSQLQATLDGGQRICVRVTLEASRRRGRIDFTGSSAAGEHNFHAPRAVTLAAVLYVFRTLVSQPIPLNAGCLRPLEIVIPPGSLLDPPAGAAVVAGNVETSQVIVDVLLAALGRLAASQGTMNNLTFGNERVQYYETIAGGAGAGPTFAGCAAVQTHMTNSRLTDPEVLEARFPVRVRHFGIRHESGGRGRHRGGDGAVRRIQFLEPMQVSMLANRRSTQPFGLAGGGDGAAGITRLWRVDAPQPEPWPACASFAVESGDVLEVLTPGGGGYGVSAPAIEERGDS
ncbi:MAG: 5-oxoprolinase [Sinobacteraceae bacterium]|nr:5-oxoprolinase [Nevskiaceae bacterium]